jgi:hypothetical protein
MTSLQLSQRALSNWGLHPKLATMVDRRGTSAENAQKGVSPGDSPTPNRDPALSAKVTTGGLTAPISRWKVGCHLQWIDGSRPPVQAPLLNISVKAPRRSHNGSEAKVIFLLDSRACFSVLPFSPGPGPGPGPMTRLLFWAYLASP